MISWVMFMVSSFVLVNNRWAIISACVIFSLMTMSANFNSFSWAQDLMVMSNSYAGFLAWLSVFIVLCSALATSNEKGLKYWCTMLSMMLVLVVCFSVKNFIMFYVMFEMSLIPIMLLIVGWGYQPERLLATTYMLLYTVMASLPMLLCSLSIYYHLMSFDVFFVKLMMMKVNAWYLLVMMLPFLVKLPIYGGHLWLPKAHVEAPLAGSMLLAGVLLKLGGYGLYLLMSFLESDSTPSTVIVSLIMLSIWGGLVSGLVCLRQNDLKAMVAYSSVVHMSVVIMSLVTYSYWGVFSGLIIMVAHGFSSSALFLISYVTYKKVGSRSLSYLSGMLSLYPTVSLLWFLMCLGNMAVPPTLNLLGELGAIPVAWVNSIGAVVIMGLIMFVSVGYNMYMYSLVNHGMAKPFLLPGVEVGMPSLLSSLLHIMPLVLIIKLSALWNN
uniref:NADH-ubiquinone oxidoreductase chain 4 n=1 Tax=Cerion uva TaxID=1108933 RepID=A0A343AZV2_9EUPU|nr:NADH dehydrogenase subunit 4 [Cerion uva]AQL10419.1 NADH dehydrogenase subunit 4 [Cerion uva]